MTLEEQIGHVLMVGFSSTPPPHVFSFNDGYGPSLFLWQVSFLRLLAKVTQDVKTQKLRLLRCTLLSAFLSFEWVWRLVSDPQKSR